MYFDLMVVIRPPPVLIDSKRSGRPVPQWSKRSGQAVKRVAKALWTAHVNSSRRLRNAPCTEHALAPVFPIDLQVLQESFCRLLGAPQSNFSSALGAQIIHGRCASAANAHVAGQSKRFPKRLRPTSKRKPFALHTRNTRALTK